MRTSLRNKSAIALSLLIVSCVSPPSKVLDTEAPSVSGTVSFATSPLEGEGGDGGAHRTTQATLGEVATEATVSLIDAQSGNTVSSSVTNASGSFVLTFKNFTPQTGAPYTLEAVKGLSVGGSPNRAGASAVRVRSLLYWNNGWQSLTNTTQGTGIAVGNSTTALSTLTSLKRSQGLSLDLNTLVGKVNESTDTFDATGTGLSVTGDFQPVLALVGSAITLDMDPVGSIAFDRTSNTYRLATGIPLVTSISPAVPSPGQTLTIRGANFDLIDGRNALWFGSIPAATWSVSADRTTLTVPVPSNAYSAPFTLQQPGGVVQTLAPFFAIRGTAGTLTGNGYVGATEGVGTDAQWNLPTGITMDSRGNLFVCDRGNHHVKRISPDGRVTVFAGSGVQGDADGTGTGAQFWQPEDITVDANDNLYVTDHPRHRIRRITPQGVVTTFAGATDGSSGTTDGTGTAARLTSPANITIDPSGNLYVIEPTRKTIRRISSGGVVTTLNSTGGFASNPAAPLTVSAASYPYGIAMNSQGDLFVGDDSPGYQIRRIVPSTGNVSVFAGDGTNGYLDNANGLLAKFNGCHDLLFDSNDNLYMVDPHSTNLIRVISPAGAVTSIGSVRTNAYADGPLSTAQFGNLHYFWRDSNGVFYVTDPNNRRIRVVTAP